MRDQTHSSSPGPQHRPLDRPSNFPRFFSRTSSTLSSSSTIRPSASALDTNLQFSCDFPRRGMSCRLSVSQLQNTSFCPDSPVIFKLPLTKNGLSAPSKNLDVIFNKEINPDSSSSSTHWKNIGFLDSSTKLQWEQIYQLPTSKNEGDVQFKLFHNFLPSLAVLHHLNLDIFSSCRWCGEKGSIHHLFIMCPAIHLALNLLHSLPNRLLPSLQLNFDVY